MHPQQTPTGRSVYATPRTSDRSTPYRRPQLSEAVSPEKTGINLLNSMSYAGRETLFNYMDQNGVNVFQEGVCNVSAETLGSLKSPLTSRGGPWYVERLTCRVLRDIKPQANGHLRVQYRIPA